MSEAEQDYFKKFQLLVKQYEKQTDAKVSQVPFDLISEFAAAGRSLRDRARAQDNRPDRHSRRGRTRPSRGHLIASEEIRHPTLPERRLPHLGLI